MLLIKEDGTVNAPIKEIAEYLGYESFNGEYADKSEEISKCYVQSKTNEEICKRINDFLNDTKVRICSSSGVRSNGIRLDLMGYFKADKSRLMRAYDDCILRERRR